MAEGKNDKGAKSAKEKHKPYKPGKMCPKCGSRMGEHQDRYACGKCGYTEFKSQKKNGA
ncbi:30S ribosomal protein S27ae [Candidatus Marsarchaeota archaeon]|nr:30S ribosomal protein S27ae [Candidatus Marsarchaeota archaeon]MCL5405019.1 30S ribosomal protein S27ae [Candidatus Marsarchaeota archaeon]